MKKSWIIIGIVLIVCLFFAGCTQNNPAETNTDTSPNTNIEQSSQNEIDIVSPKLTGLPDLNINSDDLRTIKNPRGEGVFVYVPKTDFYGVERFFLWMVIDNNAYAINGATKDLTPTLNFPRDADEGTWEKTGLNKYSASEAIKIVFSE